MRVLVVTNMYPKAAGDNCGIFVKRGVEALERLEDPPQVEVMHIDTIGHKAQYLTAARDVVRRADDFRADIIHVHYGLTLIISRKWRGRTVVTLHGGDVAIPWQRVITKWFLPKVNYSIFVGSELRELLPRVSPASVISCGVNVDEFKPVHRATARRALGWADSGTIVCFPSSPGRVEKDYGLFEKTIQCLQSQGVDVHPVVLDGWAPEDVPHVLGAADLLLFTSLQEGSPVTSKEALCCGTRVVATNAGDLRDQCRGFSGTRVFDDRDPVVLARGVCDALAEEMPSVSEARERFSIEEEASQVMAIYRKVMAT